MSVRLAIVISHPIPYFAATHRAIQQLGGVDLQVMFCCDWGLTAYRDPQFDVDVKWDVPLLDGYRHQFLPIARRPTRLGFWEVDNPSVGDALTQFNPDVVLVHGYARRTVWRAVGWARRHKRPVLLYSDSNALDRPAPLKRLAKHVIVTSFYSQVDGAICVSDLNRAYHRAFGVPDDRLFHGVIPVEVDRLLESAGNRADSRREFRRRWGVPEDAFVAMLCGKYAAHKRPGDLLRAVDRLQSRHLPVWAVLVGEGAERAELERHIEKFGTHAVLAGFVNQSNIGACYAAADVAVSVSAREPLGLAIVEGAAFGLPVIASDRVGAVGPSGGVRPGVNAITYPVGDIEALAGALENLCSDAVSYRRMCDASAALARGQTPEKAAESLASAARQLAAMGPRKRSGVISRIASVGAHS